MSIEKNFESWFSQDGMIWSIFPSIVFLMGTILLGVGLSVVFIVKARKKKEIEAMDIMDMTVAVCIVTVAGLAIYGGYIM